MQSLAQLPPPDLTPWHMFLAADVVVKTVMVLLVVASLTSWTILLGKLLEIRAGMRAVRRSFAVALRAASLEAFSATTGGAPMLAAVRTELELSGDLPPGGIRERIALRLHRIEAAGARRMGRGIGILASIGSCGPFVGLFGTVWGIMNAFIGISRMQTTNLAVVAPGIAEALLATAAGLVAAIPAVLIYNVLTRLLSAHRAALGDLSAALQVLASRDLDRTQPAVRGPARPVLLRGAAE